MNYNKIELNIKNPLSFWGNFADKERFFWYDRQKNQWLIGADRLTSVKAVTDDYPYYFHTQTFFEQTKGQLWKDFGGETLVFKHYFVKNSSESSYLSTEKHRAISEMNFDKVRHSVSEKAPDEQEWVELFEQIQASFSHGQSKKIVASREIEFTSPTSFNIESILQNLIENNPACFIFAYQKGERVFLGATPEILVQKQNEKILSYALAGTLPKSVKNAQDILLHDPKNLHEHDIVVQKIKEKMSENSEQVTVLKTEVMTLKNVYHLRTRLLAENSSQSLLEWAKQLHPTPALGGEPRSFALDFLRKHETHERGLYAAPIGVLDQEGNGTIAVGIRSALILNRRLYAYAGCGIVPSSNCLDEFNETKIKLKTILEAL